MRHKYPLGHYEAAPNKKFPLIAENVYRMVYTILRANRVAPGLLPNCVPDDL